MRYFNTSGPNKPAQHYTLMRPELVRKGMQLVEERRYLISSAPRKAGKSTYFSLLAEALRKVGYQVAPLNFENYRNEPLSVFLKKFRGELNRFWDTNFQEEGLAEIFYLVENQRDKKWVLIIDEVEGIDTDYLNDFLHAVRSAYHTRERHALKSVMLVGVSNILGIIQDSASPFNIADNFDLPYFTNEETYELLGQHETETGQLFDEKAKAKLSDITANQPGLVNGFAHRMVETAQSPETITYEDYLSVEDWYLTEAIDKNFAHVLNKVDEYRPFLEQLLFTEREIPFRVERKEIKYLHTLGLIRKNSEGKVEFWVPFYKKRLYDAFYPYTNGETVRIQQNLFPEKFFDEQGNIQFHKIIEAYQAYVRKRGFQPFREKDEQGNYKSIKEAALIYSFETYIQAFLEEAEGKSYREAQSGLGRSDLIVNIRGQETLIESKVYYSPSKFSRGKKQLAYYCKSLGLREGYYLVFVPESIQDRPGLVEVSEEVEGVTIHTFLVVYQEELGV